MDNEGFDDHGDPDVPDETELMNLQNGSSKNLDDPIPVTIKFTDVPLSNENLDSSTDTMSLPAPLKTKDGTVRMKRQIGLIGGISMIVGTMIGSGIFISPTGLLKRTDSVATSLVVWAACGLLTTFTALTYCELGTVVPRSGGEHAYYMAAFTPLHPFWGELPAFLFAWMTVTLLKPSSLAIISMSFGQYAMEPILNAMGVDKGWTEVKNGEYEWGKKMLAAVCALFIAFVNIMSAKVATRVQIFFTGAKITAMIILIGVGVYNICIGKTGSIPSSYDTGSASYGDIAMAFYSGLWAYEGWNNLNFITEELLNPAKNLPRAILIGIPLTTAFYLLINLAYLSALDKTSLENSNAVAIDVGDQTLGPVKFIIPLLVALSTIGSANGSQFTAGRICYVASRDGHLVDILSYVHAKRLTPAIAIMLNVLLAMFMIAVSNINQLIDFFSFIAWIFYALALVAVMVLRKTRPDLPRPIKIPLAVPFAALLISIFLVVAPLINDPTVEYLYVLAFTIIGVLLYYPFVFKKYQLGFMEKFTKTIQLLTLVAPSPYKED